MGILKTPKIKLVNAEVYHYISVINNIQWKDHSVKEIKWDKTQLFTGTVTKDKTAENTPHLPKRYHW